MRRTKIRVVVYYDIAVHIHEARRINLPFLINSPTEEMKIHSSRPLEKQIVVQMVFTPRPIINEGAIVVEGILVANQ